MLTPHNNTATNISFPKTEKNTNKTFSILSLGELNRMKGQVESIEGNFEDKKKREDELHKKSMQRMKKWPDSLEMVKKNQLESKKKKFIEEEKQRRLIDQEEVKYNEIQKKLVNENAAKLLFTEQDVVKSFKSNMLLSDILKEREFQQEIKSHKEEINKKIEAKWVEVEKEKMIAYDEKERKKHEEDIKKRQEQMSKINKQFGEHKLKKIREYQDYIVEGEIIKKNAKEAIQEEK